MLFIWALCERADRAAARLTEHFIEPAPRQPGCNKEVEAPVKRAPPWSRSEPGRRWAEPAGSGDTLTQIVSDTVKLYRPVGPKELELIRQSGYSAFPPRLAQQPIFYPVLNFEYARQIASTWNVRDSGYGAVTSFQVRRDFLQRYEVHTVGSAIHQEYWIPAEDLVEFNQNLVGAIKVVAEFHAIPPEYRAA
jgi:hypothetical protein